MQDEFTEETKVSIKLIATMAPLIVVIGGAWYHLSTLVSDIKWELRGIRRDVTEIHERSSANLSRVEFRSFVRELRLANPDLILPEGF